MVARWQQVRPSPGDCSAGSKELGGGGGGDGDCSGVEACCHLWCDRGGLERAIVLLLLGALLIIFSTVWRSEGAWGLKGLCHEMNKFFEGLKNQISTFCIGADSFYNFLLPCYGEIKR